MSVQRPYLFLLKITFFSLILSILPLNETLLDASPFWMLLLFSYWLVHFPVRGSLFIALILGLILDVLQGDMLGQNALALILSSLFINQVKQSFQVSNLSTQQVYIFLASCIYAGFLLAIHLLLHGWNGNYYLLLPPLTRALIWPVIRLFLSKCKP